MERPTLSRPALEHPQLERPALELPSPGAFEERINAELRANAEAVAGIVGLYHLHIEGAQSSDWTIDFDARPPVCRAGLHGETTHRFALDARSPELVRGLRVAQDRREVYLAHNRLGDIQAQLRFVSIPAIDVNGALWLLLNGTQIKVDHFDRQPMHPDGWSSFIDFGELLEGLGLTDRRLDVPVPEFGLGNLGALEAILGGFFVTTDRVRFRVDNLHSTLDNQSLTVSLEDDAIVIDAAFESNHPTLVGEGNSYFLFLHIFGIPLGWVDYTCPDIDLRNVHIRVRLFPKVDVGGNVVIDGVTGEFVGDIDSGILGSFDQQIRDTFVGAMVNELRKPEVSNALGGALQALIIRNTGGKRPKWLVVRETGLSVGI